MVDLTGNDDYMAAAALDADLVQYLLPQIGRFPEAICFHCEQAAEKMLKSMWEECGVAARRSHDLNDLIGVATERGWVAATIDEIHAAKFLSQYGAKFKYVTLKESEKGEAYEAVASLNAISRMLDRSGFRSVEVDAPGGFLHDDEPRW